MEPIIGDLEPEVVAGEGSQAGSPTLPTPGGNVMTGIAVGALTELMSPEILALQQRGGGLVSTLSQVALFGLGALIARSAPCQGISQALNGVLQHVPLLSGQGWIAQSVQLVVGSHVGQMIVRHFRPAATSGTAGPPPRIFLAQDCVICTSELRDGDVMVLDCGHACICQDWSFESVPAFVWYGDQFGVLK